MTRRGDSTTKSEKPSGNLGIHVAQPVAQTIRSPIAEGPDLVLFDREASPTFWKSRAEEGHHEAASYGWVVGFLEGHGVDRASLSQQRITMLDRMMSHVQGVVGDPHEALDRVAYPFDRLLDGGEHTDESDGFCGKDNGRDQSVKNAKDDFKKDFDTTDHQQDSGDDGHYDVEEGVQVHSFGAHDRCGMRARVRTVLHDAPVNHRIPNAQDVVEGSDQEERHEERNEHHGSVGLLD
jgi:hypothetical protein